MSRHSREGGSDGYECGRTRPPTQYPSRSINRGPCVIICDLSHDPPNRPFQSEIFVQRLAFVLLAEEAELGTTRRVKRSRPVGTTGGAVMTPSQPLPPTTSCDGLNGSPSHR